MKALKLRRIAAFVMALVMLMPFVCVPVSADTLPTCTVESTSVTDGYVNMTVDLHDYINTDMYIRLENTNGSTTFYYPTPWYDENGRFVKYVTTSPVTLRVPLPDYGIYRVNPEGYKSSNGQSWQCAPIQISYLSSSVSVATSAGIRQLEPNVNNTYYEVVGDAPTDDGVYILNKNGDYKYAVYCNAPSYEAQQAVYISSGGSVLKTEALTWKASEKIWGGATYAAADFPDAAKIEFQAVRDPSKKISIDISRVTIGSVGSVSFTTNAYDYSYQCLASYISRRYSGAVQLNELATVVSKSGESYNAYAQGNSGVFTTSCGNFSSVGSEVVDMTAGGWRNAAGTGEDEIWTTPALYHYAPSGTTVNISIDAAGASKTVAALIYKSKDGKEVTVEHEYSGSAAITVPSDAMQLLYVEARVYNERGEVSATKKTKLENYYCSNFVEFTNVPDSVCNFTSYKNMDGYFRGFEKRTSQGGFVLTVTDSAGKTYRTYLANTKRYKFDPDWHVLGNAMKTTSGWDIYPYFSYGTSTLASNVPSYEMGGTMPNLSVGKCTYELTSDGRHVTSGTFTVTGEFGQKVALNDIPEQYQSFHVNVSSASANGGKEIPAEVVMDITTPDGQTNRISSPASDSKPAFIPFLPVGSRIKAAVRYDADAYPFIKGVSPANGEYTLVYDNDRQQSLDFAFEAIAKRSITGKTVTGTGADKKAVPYANIVVSQPITRNDGSSYTHKTVATSDENGDFTIPDAYAGYAGKIEIRAVGYSVAESTLASGTSAASLGEITLDYYGDYAIIPFLSKEPSALRGADGNFAKDDDGNMIGNELDGSLIDADASLLSINTIEINGTIYQRGTDWFETERDGQSFVTFRNLSVLSSAASSGKNVIVHYNRPADNIFDVDGEKMTLRSFDITAKFGADKKLAARAVAYDPMGEISVTACDAENEGYVGYAVLSDGEQTLQNGSKDINVIGWASGTGELIIPYKSSTKSHKLYTFYVNADDANLMSQLLKSGRPDLLDSADSGAIKTTNISKLVENSTVTLGSKQPSSCYSNIGFGPYGFDYVINAYSNDMDYAELRGIITKRDISDRGKDALYSVELSGTDSGSALIVNGEEPAGDGIWYNKNTGADKLRNIISVPVYALIPYKSGTNTVDFGLTLSYKNNGAISSDSLSITEDVLNFDISVPENVNVRDELEKAGWTNGQHFDDYPWQLGINITAYKGDDRENTITIWDNGAAIGTLNAAELNGATERKFKLTDMFDAGTHSIWATREKRSGSGYVTVSTPKKSVYLNLSERDIYSGAMIWYHNGKRQGTTVSVAPSRPSIVVFPIYGASADELENVYLETNKNGVFRATLACDDPAHNRSWWIVGTDKISNISSDGPTSDKFYADLSLTAGAELGTSTEFAVNIGYTLPAKIESANRETLREQALKDYYNIMGLDVPDCDNGYDQVDEWVNYTEAERKLYYDTTKDSIPDEIAELQYSLDVSQDGKTYTYTAAPTETIQQSKLILTVGENKEYTLSELFTQLDKERGGQIEEDDGCEIYWATRETVQGRVLERLAVKNWEEQVNGKTQYHSYMRKTVYVPSEVRDAMYEAAGYSDAISVYSADDDAPLTAYAAKRKTKAKTNSDGDPLLKKGYDWVSFGQSAVDLHESLGKSRAIYEATSAGLDAEGIKDAAKAAGYVPEAVGKIANGLNVIDTVYIIARGPAGESGDKLWKMLKYVKDQKARKSLSHDIQDYLELRQSSYVMDSTVKVATCSAGFWDPSPESTAAKGAFAVKLGLFLGGWFYGKTRDYANEYQAETYRTIEHDILERIRFEEAKVKHAQQLKQAKDVIENRLKKLHGYVSPKMLEEELSKYWVLVNENGKLKYRLKSKMPKVNVYIDPSGYVFEAVEDNRVGGITAAIYQADDKGDFNAPWADPNEDAPQDNPQTTAFGEGDLGGRYGWMVPSGDWKVKFTDENKKYKDAETVIIQVPPEHTNVNIGLMSEETPTVKMETKNGKIVLTFSKYMRLDTLVRAGASQKITLDAQGAQTSSQDTSTSYEDESFGYDKLAIAFYTSTGKQIKGTVSFPDKARNTGYTPDSPYQTDWIYCDYFAKTAVFTPTDGSSVSGATMKIGEGIQSYSGIALPADSEVINAGELTVTKTATGSSTATYTAALNTDEKCVIIAASYNSDGTIYAVKTAYTSNGSTDITVDVPYSGARVVVRAWDSLGSMHPVSDAVVTTG